MRHTALLLTSSFVLAGSLFAKDAPLRTPEQRFGSLSAAEDPSFRRHVVPLISRAGCSGRECHGSFQGRGGFQLSLFGYDFEKDHKAITQDANGGEAEVRVNLKEPAESLIIKKGAELMKHKGKQRFTKDSWEYNLLLKWVQGGAKIDVEQTGDFDRLEVQPKEIVFKKAGDVVVATPEPHPEKVVDIMEALKASLAAAKKPAASTTVSKSTTEEKPARRRARG